MPRKSFPAALKAAFPHTVPILTGYLAVGLAYGLLMSSKGYNFLWSGFVSAFAFCGSMQYVAITLLTTAFDPLSAFFLSLMVNARHLFFSLALLPKYRGLGRLRYFLIYTLSDENFSLSSTVEPPEDTDPTLFYFAMSLLTWLYWVAFSMLGGLIGGLITFDITGIDFALTALFVVLFIEQVIKRENRPAGFMGLACSVAGLAVFGADSMVIPAMVLTLIALLLGRKNYAPEFYPVPDHRLHGGAGHPDHPLDAVSGVLRRPEAPQGGGGSGPSAAPGHDGSAGGIQPAEHRPFTGSHGLPEAIAVAVTAGLHLWKRSTLLSILAGTAVYMLLVQLVFV